MNAPPVVENVEVAAALRADRSIREVLEVARQPQVALAGIGAINPEMSTQFHAGYLTFNDLRELEKLGVVGDMCICYFNILGEHVSVPWIDSRVVGIT